MATHRFRGGPRNGELIEVPGEPPQVYVPNPADMNAVIRWTDVPTEEVMARPASPIQYTRERLRSGAVEYWSADYRDREVRLQRSMRERVADLEQEVAKLKAILREE